MSFENLAAYLNDHLAGSVVALEMLAHLEQATAGTAVATTLAAVRAEIAKDREELEALIAGLGVAQSGPRQAVAWLAEKAAQVKLALDGSASDGMHLFEGLEGVSLGIEGKRGLWRTLAVVAAERPALRALDYERLIRRAEEQREQVEALRLVVAPRALGE